eukprot:CAMPEP_0174233122 /NCGR_PEP_ID=MMETSP0417-20130205/3242_1 /TAXON_ID=242541 /ORGANISM="Mayorella sp, Strain BSH-02190019" /LENGTH=874 /DNA_ID=CAMNT_0015311289 /DNA_START=79 /DNA_END=2703 /DNA_ORIENTATION=-
MTDRSKTPAATSQHTKTHDTVEKISETRSSNEVGLSQEATRVQDEHTGVQEGESSLVAAEQQEELATKTLEAAAAAADQEEEEDNGEDEDDQEEVAATAQEQQGEQKEVHDYEWAERQVDELDQCLAKAVSTPRERPIVVKLESRLRQFLSRKQPVTCCPANSYQRLLIHRVAQRLGMSTRVTTSTDGRRSVLVCPPSPADMDALRAQQQASLTEIVTLLEERDRRLAAGPTLNGPPVVLRKKPLPSSVAPRQLTGQRERHTLQHQPHQSLTQRHDNELGLTQEASSSSSSSCSASSVGERVSSSAFGSSTAIQPAMPSEHSASTLDTQAPSSSSSAASTPTSTTTSTATNSDTKGSTSSTTSTASCDINDVHERKQQEYEAARARILGEDGDVDESELFSSSSSYASTRTDCSDAKSDFWSMQDRLVAQSRVQHPQQQPQHRHHQQQHHQQPKLSLRGTHYQQSHTHPATQRQQSYSYPQQHQNSNQQHRRQHHSHQQQQQQQQHYQQRECPPALSSTSSTSVAQRTHQQRPPTAQQRRLTPQSSYQQPPRRHASAGGVPSSSHTPTTVSSQPTDGNDKSASRNSRSPPYTHSDSSLPLASQPFYMHPAGVAVPITRLSTSTPTSTSTSISTSVSVSVSASPPPLPADTESGSAGVTGTIAASSSTAHTSAGANRLGPGAYEWPTSQQHQHQHQQQQQQHHHHHHQQQQQFQQQMQLQQIVIPPQGMTAWPGSHPLTHQQHQPPGPAPLHHVYAHTHSLAHPHPHHPHSHSHAYFPPAYAPPGVVHSSPPPTSTASSSASYPMAYLPPGYHPSAVALPWPIMMAMQQPPYSTALPSPSPSLAEPYPATSDQQPTTTNNQQSTTTTTTASSASQ